MCWLRFGLVSLQIQVRSIIRNKNEKYWGDKHEKCYTKWDKCVLMMVMMTMMKHAYWDTDELTVFTKKVESSTLHASHSWSIQIFGRKLIILKEAFRGFSLSVEASANLGPWNIPWPLNILSNSLLKIILSCHLSSAAVQCAVWFGNPRLKTHS